MKNIIGIRREDLSKKGEQRVPITPGFVSEIVAKGHSVLVQPAMHPKTHELKRAFRDVQFTQAGAHVQENISEAKLIVGLKEIAIESIFPDKAYCCFSHTHKGQKKNREMLQAFYNQRSTLIDYELVTDANGQRTVTAFTYYAGYAGMIDTLWATAQRLHLKGQDHPFAAIPQAFRYDDLDEFKRLLAEIGEDIQEEGTPAELPPFISIVLGDGKTSKGAQEIFNILPVKQIRPEEIEAAYNSGNRKQVYQCVMHIGDMFRPKVGTAVSRADWDKMDMEARSVAYLTTPMDFESTLASYLPFATIVLNCIVWSPKYQRVVTKAMVRDLWFQGHHLEVIGDISCDPNGGVEFSMETWIDNPVFVYHPLTEESTLGMTGEGVAVMAVTNLPCEFSKDSSEQFARDLAHLLPSLVDANFEGSLEESGLDDELKRGVILWKGQFTEKYAYMMEYLPEAVPSKS